MSAVVAVNPTGGLSASLFQGHGLQAPWALTLSTTDRVLAQQWLTEWTAVGVEGLVIKGLGQSYQPGRRGWLKYRTRSTAEAVIGAVTGSLIRPETVLLGRYTSDGRFLLVARSTPLAPRIRAELGGGLLAPAGADHPWRDVDFTSHWGSREPLAFTPVAPQLVAEFHGDTAVDRGRWRHPSISNGSVSTSPPTTSRFLARSRPPVPQAPGGRAPPDTRPPAGQGPGRSAQPLARLLPPCYLESVSSDRKQTQLRLEPDVLAAGKDAAAARGLDFNRYVERLIAEDTSGARAAGMAAAQRLIDHHGDFLDGLEADLDTQHAPAPNARGAAA
ncbi:hypothetical protein ACQEVG_37675 [Streptomyces sp. CA-135486]|uniref:hypothetical protein n=1 Tax=Streptomyces sp. CA-135486 TaxID=3240049 RepID=UPI003D93BB1A